MNRFEKALERLKKYVEPNDSWTDEDWDHYRSIIDALNMAAQERRGR